MQYLLLLLCVCVCAAVVQAHGHINVFLLASSLALLLGIMAEKDHVSCCNRA